jgi:hypothetical protein
VRGARGDLGKATNFNPAIMGGASWATILQLRKAFEVVEARLRGSATIQLRGAEVIRGASG